MILHGLTVNLRGLDCGPLLFSRVVVKESLLRAKRSGGEESEACARKEALLGVLGIRDNGKNI